MNEPSDCDSTDRSGELRRNMEEALASGAGPKAARFALACLGGIPVVGGAIGGAASAWSEADQAKINRIVAAWLKLQEDEIREIGTTMAEIMLRVDRSDSAVLDRLESREFLALIKKAFRDWSAAESEEKRLLIRNLLTNAATKTICSDDIIRLFIDWIGKYSEAHFSIIRALYRQPGSTRHDIWQLIHGTKVREDSAEADLFKLLIDELAIGRIIRQHREVDGHGNFLKRPSRPKGNSSSIMKSAFDDENPYELTALGKQFVQYSMEDVLPKLDGPVESASR